MATRAQHEIPSIDSRPALVELKDQVLSSLIQSGFMRWDKLGLELKLNQSDLEVMEHLDKDKQPSGLIKLWLDRNPDATRKDLIEALRNMELTAIAETYDKWIKQVIDQVIKETKHKSLIDSMLDVIQNDTDIANLANDLEGQFDNLLLDIRNMHHSKASDAKLVVLIDLQHSFGFEFCEVFQESLNEIKDLDELVTYLCNNEFVTFITYGLLKKISELSGDIDVSKRFDVYEKTYTKLLKSASFGQIVAVFQKNPDLKPGCIVGFPLLKFKLERPDLYHHVYGLESSPISISHGKVN